MNVNIFCRALTIARQLHHIGNKVTGWLSDSGKGVKECIGWMRHVEQTARGLAIILQGGKRVAWRVLKSVADVVIRLINLHVTKLEATDLAIGLAMNKAKFDGITDECAANAACEVYVNADRTIVWDVLTSWV